MTVFIVDTSNWDDSEGILDWGAVRNAGVVAMLHKASEGDPSGYNYVDPYYRQDVLNARAAGVPLVGGYHVISRGDQASINRQVDWLLRKADEVGGYQTGWWMLDVEPFDELTTRGIWPRLDDVLRFEARWASLTNDWPLAHYIPHWFWERPSVGWGGVSMAALRGPLVSSAYPVGDLTPFRDLYIRDGGDNGPGWASYGGKAPAIWQFASSARVPGLYTGSDINAYRGTAADLISLVTGRGDDMSQAIEDIIQWELRPWTADASQAAGRIEVAVTAGFAANEVRDKAMLAAVQALVAGGTSVDTAAVLAAINNAAQAESAAVAALQATIVDLRQRLAATAQAGADHLSGPAA